MEQTIKKSEAANLLEALSIAAKQQKMPLKFCIARNLKALQPIVEAYNESKDILFKNAVKLDENGNGCLREGVHITSERVSFDLFEYNNEDAKKEFFEKIAKLNDETINITFIKEKLNRPIQISMQDGTYRDTTVQDVLDDPNNNIAPITIALFLDYILEE